VRTSARTTLDLRSLYTAAPNCKRFGERERERERADRDRERELIETERERQR